MDRRFLPRPRLVLAALFVLLLALMPGVASAEPPRLDPQQGPPGTKVTATGSIGPAGNHIRISGWGADLATTTAGSNGTFTVTFTVPSTAKQGAEQVRFWDVEGRTFQVATFTVEQGTPSPKPSPSKSSPPSAASGPSFVYPKNDQTLDYEGAYLFKVNPVAGASGYLWGFFQGGKMVWENYRDERKLSGTEYGIHPGTAAHSKFVKGDVDVWVRGYVNGQWTDATIIKIHLQPRTAPPGGLWVHPRNNFVVQGDRVHFAARAYPANKGGTSVDYVNFTATWSGSGWRVVCRSSGVSPLGIYECDWNFAQALPRGTVTVSFDVYDRAGNRRLAPNGLRKGRVEVLYVGKRYGSTTDAQGKHWYAEFDPTISATTYAWRATGPQGICPPPTTKPKPYCSLLGIYPGNHVRVGARSLDFVNPSVPYGPPSNFRIMPAS